MLHAMTRVRPPAASTVHLSASRTTLVGHAAHSTVVPSAAITPKTMTAPPMAIAPACPWAHAHEDAVVEVA